MRQVPFSPPDISELEINEVAETLRSGWITTGPRVKQFEWEIAAYCHTEQAVCLNSCTAALELTLRVLGVGPGDQVIVPAYTYTASASVIHHVGAEIVMADTAPGSFEMDYDKLAGLITGKTKAVIAVDIGGVICDYDKIFNAVNSQKHRFCPVGPIQSALGRAAVVADAAHAFGAVRQGKVCGEIADFTAFSFHAVKNLTTAEGGAVVWRGIPGIGHETLYHEFQLLSLHGQSKDALAKTKLGAWEYDIIYPAYKCNMPDIMAAIGQKQLARYPALLQRRREIIRQYDSVLYPHGVLTLAHSGPGFCSSGHLYLTRLPGVSRQRRDRVITALAQRGVAANVHYKPLPLMTAYQNMGFDGRDYKNAVKQFENEITLPLHTGLSDADVAYVVEMFLESIGEG